MMASLIEHGIRSPAVLHAMADVPTGGVRARGRSRARLRRPSPPDRCPWADHQPAADGRCGGRGTRAARRRSRTRRGDGLRIPGRGDGRVRRPRREHRTGRVAGPDGRGASPPSRLRRRGRRGRRHARRAGAGALRCHRGRRRGATPPGRACPAAGRRWAPGGADQRRRPTASSSPGCGSSTVAGRPSRSGRAASCR